MLALILIINIMMKINIIRDIPVTVVKQMKIIKFNVNNKKDQKLILIFKIQIKMRKIENKKNDFNFYLNF